jgi:sugar lactone lactonase YvrE
MGKTKHELKNWWQMATLPQSKLTRPRNKIVYWSDTDSEENFRLNPKHGYTETSITYEYNSQGFRTKEFEPASNRTNVLFKGL